MHRKEEETQRLSVEFIGGLEERIVSKIDEDLLIEILATGGDLLEDCFQETSTDWTEVAESLDAIRDFGFGSGHIRVSKAGEVIWVERIQDFLAAKGESPISGLDALATALRYEVGFYIALVIDGGGVALRYDGEFPIDIELVDIAEELMVRDTGVLSSLTLADEDEQQIEFSADHGGQSYSGPRMALFYAKATADSDSSETVVITPEELRDQLRDAGVNIDDSDAVRRYLKQLVTSG